MSKITGNEPAHPIPVASDTNGDILTPMAWDEYNTNQSGLTIRQHYSGLAMQALISNPNTELTKFDKVIELSVVFADLLIMELNKPKS